MGAGGREGGLRRGLVQIPCFSPRDAASRHRTRRMSKPGLSLVHEIAVDGTQGHLKLDVGAP